ncbi:hypothetical protein ACYOEI_27655 [Singulisphaera rosea]
MLNISLVGLGMLLAIAASVYANRLRSLLLSERCCPNCGPKSSLSRIPRQWTDRLIGGVIACRRYQCFSCRWSGLIRDRATKPSGRPGGTTEFELPVFPADARGISGHHA